jgi:hypothetical protein
MDEGNPDTSGQMGVFLQPLKVWFVDYEAVTLIVSMISINF